MEKPLYQSLYVLAGKREDGTYGIMRNRPLDTVDCFDTAEEAERVRSQRTGVIETIVIDIGLLVDSNIKREGNTIDASVRVQRA